MDSARCRFLVPRLLRQWHGLGRGGGGSGAVTVLKSLAAESIPTQQDKVMSVLTTHLITACVQYVYRSVSTRMS